MKQRVLYFVVWCLAVSMARVGAAAEPYCTAEGYLGAGGGNASGGQFRADGYDAFDVEDNCQRYSSGFERLWHSIHEYIRRRRLLGYKRIHSGHPKFLYPRCPPYCSPTFGYHRTLWRPFPQYYEYSWTSQPSQPVLPTPVAEPELFPLTPTPPTPPASTPEPAAPDSTPGLAPPAEKPYFPESAPLIQPSNEAPPPPPAERKQSPDVGGVLPARRAVEPASYDLPVIMRIQQ